MDLNIDLGTLLNNLSQMKKDPASFPLPVKIFIAVLGFVVVLVISYFLFVSHSFSKWSSLIYEEKKLKTEYVKKKTTAVNLPNYKKYHEALIDNLSFLLNKLPKEYQVNMLLRDINKIGLNHQMVFYSFRPQKKITHELYVEQPVSVVVSGTYSNFSSFLLDLTRLNNLVVLTDLNIDLFGQSSFSGKKEKKGDRKQLVFSFVAHVFHAAHALKEKKEKINPQR